MVAYKQPVSRSRVSAIRGVNVDGVMRTLLTRGLVEEAGTDHETGAHLYRTSSYFLERIGVTSLDELPELAPFLPGVDDFEDEQEVAAEASRARPPTARARHRGRDVRPHGANEAGRDRRRGAGPAAEAAGPVGRGQPAQVRGADARRAWSRSTARSSPGSAPRSTRRTAVIRVEGRRLPPVSDARLPGAEQARAGSSRRCRTRRADRTLADFVADRPERLFHVGRLDTDTDGLILLTNDGDFAQQMAHPSYEVDKTYVAEVDGRRRASHDPAAAGRGRARGRPGRGPRGARCAPPTASRSIVELVIHEGRNRIVRRLLDHVGHPVRRLTRTRDRAGAARPS